MSVPLSEDDLANAQFAIGVELAARDLYQAAIDAGASGTAWAILADQHSQYAQRVAGLTGIPANTRDATVYDSRVANFQGDRPANAPGRYFTLATASSFLKSSAAFLVSS